MSFRDFQTILLKFSDMTRIFHDVQSYIDN